MKVLLSGASGFLGKYIWHALHQSNEVITLSRSCALINVDLAKEIPVLPIVDLVIHSAGKAHSFPRTEEERQVFYDVNLKGTENLLKGLSNSKNPDQFVFISSVSVYGLEQGECIHEECALKAKDPYGNSKILAEGLIREWCKKHNVLLTILRLPLLVGQNPPGNLGSMIKAIQKGYYFNIAGGHAKKSMVLAEDVAKAILIAAEKGGTYNLTDGFHPSFCDVSERISLGLGKRKPKSIPGWLSLIISLAGDIIGKRAPLNSKALIKMTSNLTFDDSRARKNFGWAPTDVLERLNDII
jgi:nucleoside-diphosphate-sugar epimerase